MSTVFQKTKTYLPRKYRAMIHPTFDMCVYCCIKDKGFVYYQITRKINSRNDKKKNKGIALS